MVGAGDMPIAIPLICFTVMSPNLIRLLNITISVASSKAVDENPYLPETSVFERYPVSWAKQSLVLMLGYIAIALYVKRLALFGSDSASSSVFNSTEFLK